MAAGVQLNALDMRSLADLKRLARDGNSPEGLKGAARQFEALFLQMVIKSMRDASPKDGLFDSDQTRMFQQLHDQQIERGQHERAPCAGADHSRPFELHTLSLCPF